VPQCMVIQHKAYRSTAKTSTTFRSAVSFVPPEPTDLKGAHPVSCVEPPTG